MLPDRARDRLFSKTTPSGECLLWTGPVDKDGYGDTGLFGEKRAHRAAWVAVVGPIPAGACVLHRCDVPRCIYPGHLFLGTPAENMYDRARKGRYARGDKHHWRARPETVPRGQDHHAAKLTDAEVQEIRELYRPGYGNKTALAKKYGCTSGNIWRIVNSLTRMGDSK